MRNRREDIKMSLCGAGIERDTCLEASPIGDDTPGNACDRCICECRDSEINELEFLINRMLLQGYDPQVLEEKLASIRW